MPLLFVDDIPHDGMFGGGVTHRPLTHIELVLEQPPAAVQPPFIVIAHSPVEEQTVPDGQAALLALHPIGIIDVVQTPLTQA